MISDCSLLVGEWKATSLGGCCDVVTSTISYTDFLNNPSAFAGDMVECMGVKVSDMNLPGNGSAFTTANAVRKLPKSVATQKLVPPNTVVFPKRGAAISTNKKRMTTTWTALDPNLIGLRPKNGLDEQFLFYWSQTLDLRKITDPGPTPQLNKKDLLPVQISFPVSVIEQRKIARVLSAVQRAIERQERLIALTAELKKALMHKLFTEGTRGEPLKQTEIGPVPQSWQVVRLDLVAKIERGKFAHRPRNAPEFYGGNIPFVQTGDVSQCDGSIERYTQTLNEKGLAISRMFPKGTILMTIAANIGFTGILGFDSACTDSLVAISPTHGDSVGFLNHYLRTQQPIMDRMAPQGTQKNINIQFLKPWPVPRPSRAEQQEIECALDTVDRTRRARILTRDNLTQLFRTLLHELMTAQIRVHDLDLSALDALGEQEAK